MYIYLKALLILDIIALVLFITQWKERKYIGYRWEYLKTYIHTYLIVAEQLYNQPYPWNVCPRPVKQKIFVNYDFRTSLCTKAKLSYKSKRMFVCPSVCQSIYVFYQKNLLTSEPISRNVWNESWRLHFKVLLLSLLLYLCANNLRYTSGILRDKTMDIEIMYTPNERIYKVLSQRLTCL